MALLDEIDLLASDVSVGDQQHDTMHDYIHRSLKDLKTVFLTLDSASVKITGNQTLAGIKTFQNSPIVPTPTTDFQASTKKYVDDGLATKTNTGHTHTIANITSLQTTLDEKAPLASPTFTGTVSGITKGMVGLGNVDNTTDLLKPISTATQNALNGKAASVHTHAISDITNLQSSLDAKATDSALVHLTGNETIGGTKTFSTGPRLTPSSTAGYAWLATDSAGNGAWSAVVNAPGGTVPWANITGRPTTFPPEAHVHAITDVTNLTTTLSGKVDTTRTIASGTGLSGGGDLSANRTLSVLYGTTAGTAAQGNDARLNDTRTPTDNTVGTTKYVDGSITTVKMATTARAYDVSYTQSIGSRKVGTGEVPLGTRISRSITFTQAVFRFETADASGSTVVQVRKNGASVYSATITAPALTATVTGTVTFVDGDILTVYTNSVGTTPGKGLVADLLGYLS